MTLGKAGGFIAIIGGLLALAASLPILMLGDVASAFKMVSEEDVSAAKWVYGGSSVLVVVFGSMSLAKPRSGAMGLIIVAGLAAWTGVEANLNLFTLAMLMAFAGGLMALFSKESSPLPPQRQQVRPPMVEWRAPPPPAIYVPPPPPGAPIPPPPWERPGD